MPLHGKNFVGGDLSGGGSHVLHAVDPATSARLEPGFHEATREEVSRALEAAGAAFEAYRRRSPEDRAAFLEKAAEEILALGDELIARARAETALPEARLVAERGRTVGQIRAFAALIREGSWVDARIDRADPTRKPVPKPDVRRMLVPIGPVVVFGASNFPLAFSAAGGDSVSALAAGNPVVVKAHPAHPGASELAATAVQRAARATGVPPGVFSLLQGARHEIGIHLVTHPIARAVGFTGSLRGGRALHDAAASRPEPIPVHAEMGSINPVFVLPGALAERAEAIAEGLHASIVLGTGQFCTNPGVIVGVDGPELERLVARLRQLIAATPAGTMLHEGILSGYEAGLLKLTMVDGVRLLEQSGAVADPRCTHALAALCETSADGFIGRRELRDEVFGPSSLLVRCDRAAELESVARCLPGTLTATIHAAPGDLASCGPLVDILREKAGRLIFNGYPTGVEVCPSMHHGGPYPATTDSRATSVGTAAILRFARPVCFQDFPDEALPVELRNRNARGIWRLVDGALSRGDL